MAVSRSIHGLVPSPFNPVKSFTAVACGMEQITIKEAYMSSEAFGVRPAEKLVQQLVAARTAKFLGQDPQPFIDEAIVNLKAVANEHGYALDPMDDAAQAAVEGVSMRVAAE